MEIVYSRNLAEYLLSKNRPHILIEAGESKSHSGSLGALTARAVSYDEMAHALPRAKAAYRGFIGKVLVMVNGCHFGDRIELGLHSIFGGIKDVEFESDVVLA